MNPATTQKENKRRFQIWIKPSVLREAENLREEDNCKSISEFIEKAVRFYAGYLKSQSSKEYLPDVIISSVNAAIADSDERHNRMLFKMAVQYLLGKQCAVVTPSPMDKPKSPKHFELPAKHDNMRRAYAYLIHRCGINRHVLDEFAKHKMIYESAGNHNVVFVGYDANGVPRHAQKRSTAAEGTYKGNATGSMMEHSFHWHGTSPNLFLFEAPIDMLSYISMLEGDWRQHSYAAACSVTDKVLFQMMQDNPNIQTVFVCFDNDEVGQIAARKLCAKLSSMEIPASVLVPSNKDWNEDLLHIQQPVQQPAL